MFTNNATFLSVLEFTNIIVTFKLGQYSKILFKHSRQSLLASSSHNSTLDRAEKYKTWKSSFGKRLQTKREGF